MLDSNNMLMWLNALSFVLNLALYYSFDYPVNGVCAVTSLVGLGLSAYGRRRDSIERKITHE